MQGALDLDPLSRGGSRTPRQVEAGEARLPRWNREHLLAVERERMAWIHVQPARAHAPLRRRVGRRPAAAPGDRPAHAHELRHGVSRVHVQRLGHLPLGGPRRRRRIRGSTRIRAGSTASPSTTRARRSTRGCATACTWAPPAGTSTWTRPSQIGMPRAYGYGATMGAWVTDYVAYWAGHEGFVRYSNTSYRGPAYEGDVTYLDAEVIGAAGGVGVGRAAGSARCEDDESGRRADGHGQGRRRASALKAQRLQRM